MSTMLKAIMEKVDIVHEQMSNVSKEMETKKNEKFQKLKAQIKNEEQK